MRIGYVGNFAPQGYSKGIEDLIDNKIIVRITDNGEGIEKQHISRLFERFYRTDTSRSRQIGGSGLGLAIVKHIIEAHNQTINVRSTEGIGSTFGFTLQKHKDNFIGIPLIIPSNNTKS